MRTLLLTLLLIFLITGTLSEDGSKCSVKAYKFCRLQRECRRGECLNTNRREPRRRTERRKYCANVSCDLPCVCPQDLDPVCDQEGNKYDNKECAQCDGVDLETLQPCQSSLPGLLLI